MNFPHPQYPELPKAAIARILAFDADQGYAPGPGAERANRTRFYHYLTQRGSDLQIRTLAVRRPHRLSPEAVAKEVALSSVDDQWIHIRDVAHHGMAGYVVDWTPEGFGMPRYWDYKGRWESEAWAPRCLWRINAPVVNPELLTRTKRFRWCCWTPACGHILDYLKVYREHPGVEFLAKQGLEHLATKTSLVCKLERDRAFRQFFSLHLGRIRKEAYTVPVIIRAYNRRQSFEEADRAIEDRRQFRYSRLPRSICATRALDYIRRQHVLRDHYTLYLRNCIQLGMILQDTKVAFPKNFARQSQIVQDQVDALERAKNAKLHAALNRKLASVAEEWAWLERLRGAFRIQIPRSMQDLKDEGKALDNCLGQGQYAAKVARGEFLIVFVRKARMPSQSYVAAEYRIKDGVLTQCYGSRNSKPPKDVLGFVKRSFDRVNKKQRKAA